MNTPCNDPECPMTADMQTWTVERLDSFMCHAHNEMLRRGHPDLMQMVQGAVTVEHWMAMRDAFWDRQTGGLQN